MYPGNKRSNEDLSSGLNENKRNRNATSVRTDYRFLIAASDAHAIFGRNGENYPTIRNKYHNQIDVSQVQTPERVLILYGEEDRAMAILADLLPIMAQNQGVRPGFVELRAMIHSSQAGAVIVSEKENLGGDHSFFYRRERVAIESKNFDRSII